MNRPSRLMPPLRQPPLPWRLRLIANAAIAVLAGIFLWLAWKWPLATLGISLAYVWLAFVMNRRIRARLRIVAQARNGESICTFARALPIRDLDTWVVRAVFEQLQHHLRSEYASFPLRPSDRLADDLQIDPEDLEMEIVCEIAQRSGRSLINYRSNPYYEQTVTVEGLVRFFCAQPKCAT